MKKDILYIIAVLALGLPFLASCGSDDEMFEKYTRPSTITIDSASVTFDAAGGDGFIAVNSPTDITVRSKAKWYTVSVQGKRIMVNAGVNDNLESRSSQMTIFNGQDSINITVLQTGLVFQFSGDASLGLDDDGTAKNYTMKHNIPVTMETSEPWLHATLDGEKMSVSADKNTTGHIRTGWVKYYAGTFGDSIYVSQFDYDKDLAGAYDLTYDDGTGQQKSQTVTLGRDSLGNTNLTFDNYGFTIPVTVSDNGVLYVNAAQYAGMMGKYYIFSTFLGTDGSFYVNSDMTIESPFSYAEGQGTTLSFVGSHMWAEMGSEFYAWGLCVCKDKTLDVNSYLGAMEFFVSPKLKKL